MSDYKGKILIVDDDKLFCDIKTTLLERNNYAVESVQSANLVVDKLKSARFDLVLLDLKIGDKNGIEVLEDIKEFDPDIIVIMITGFESTATIVQAIKKGAYDYLQKTIKEEELLIKIDKAIEKHNDSLEIRTLKDALTQQFSFSNIVGVNEKMNMVYTMVKTVCNTDSTVLIHGETGSGKELIAKAIHFNSQRKDKPFIAVNCAAISEHLMESELFGHEKGAFTDAYKQRIGKIEFANHGTLFLDEIGDMSLNLQAKFLRFLQDKTFERVGGNITISSDTRVIAATNKDLSQMIKEGKFREDLYYRINVMYIELPPLRERLDDLPLLIDHFIKRSNIKFGKSIKGISQDGMRLLNDYNWPGNIRELENLIDRVVLTSENEIISSKGLSSYFPSQGITSIETAPNLELSMREFREECEKMYLTGLLKKYFGNIPLVAEKAGMHRTAIYLKIEKYDLDKIDFKKI